MVPGLYDPLGFSKGRSEEAKARGRASEIKNGRLASEYLVSFVYLHILCLIFSLLTFIFFVISEQ